MEKKSLYISLIVGGTFLIENIDGTVITTSLPEIAKAFNTNPAHMSISVSAYVIMLAVFIPVSGWITERFGMKKVFGTAILGFLFFSALCGFCQNLIEFTLCRVFQGIFGAMMVPVGRLSVLRNTAKKDLINAIAFITWPGLIGPVIGPFVGGYITTYFSWHWIFFINIPLGLIAFYFAMKFIPETNEISKKRLDWKGFVLSTLGMLGFMVGLEGFGNSMIPLIWCIIIITVSLFIFYLFYLHSRRITNPLISFRDLKIRTYAVTIYSGSITRMVIGMAPFLVPLMFQIGFGLNAFQAGSLMIATTIGNLVMKPITIWIFNRFSFKNVLVSNTIFLSLSSLSMCILFPNTPNWIVLATMFISGAIRSVQFSSLNTLAYADVPKERMNNANVLYSTAQQMSLGMGITLGAITLHISSYINNTNGDYKLKDFHLAFVLIAIFGMFSIFEYLKLKQKDGNQVRNIKSKKKNL